ncbi:MAG: PQQ-binding-like beta-propeller repeat protein [Methanoregula sp.]|nr:PQQ-binding-like beta-propeller repeat protein [Methanoregula sp.]
MSSRLSDDNQDDKSMTVRSNNSKRRSLPPGIWGGTWRLLIIPVLLIMILPIGVNAMMFRNDSSHSGIYDDGGTRPNEVLKWSNLTGDAVYGTPAVADGVVYIGSNDNYMRAFNATTGASLWDFYGGGDIDSSAAVVNERVIFGSYDRKVYALTLAGDEDWSYTTSAIIRTSPAVADGFVYIACDNGMVYALHEGSGVLEWSNTTNTTPMVSNAMHSSPAVSDGRVFVGSEDNKLYAFNATDGVELWNYTTGGPIKSSPAVADGVVYFGSYDHNVYAIYADSGELNWLRHLSSNLIESSPAVADGVVYIGSSDGGLYALDVVDGTDITEDWPYNTATGWGPSPSNGDNASVYSSPAVANGVVYVGSYTSDVLAIATNGTKIWNYTTDGYIYSSPAVWNGIVYIGGGGWTDSGANFGMNLKMYAIGNVTIAPTPPTAAFTNATPRSGTAPLTVTFTDQSTGTLPLTYAWDFTNDGVIDSTAENPSHEYSTAGTYTVNLTVTNTAGSDSEVKTDFITVSPATSAGNDGIAIFRNSTGYWYFDHNLDGTVNKSFRFGGSTDQIIKGDWNGDGKDGIAIFRPSTGYWYFDNNLDGVVDKSFRYGGSTDRIIVGNWQGTQDGIAIFRPSTGYWYFDYNLDGTVNKSFRYGGSTDQIIKGDWNGDGNDGIAIFRPSTGYWYFDNNLDGAVDKSFRYGGSTDRIIVGKWNSTMQDGIAIFRPSTGYWYFDYNLDGTVDKSFRFGGSTDQIIKGDWNGDGKDGIAIFRPSTGYWYFDNNLDGAVDKSFRYGGSTDRIIAGTWA